MSSENGSQLQENKEEESKMEPMETNISSNENSTVLITTMDSDLDPRSVLKCGLCPYKGKSNSMSKHMKHHRIKSKNSCPHCSYTSSYKAVLEKHISIHKADLRKRKLIHCQYCPYAGKKEAFDYHVKNHFKQSKFRCMHCTYSSPYRSVTERHFKLHKPSAENDLSPTQLTTVRVQPSNSEKLFTRLLSPGGDTSLTTTDTISKPVTDSPIDGATNSTKEPVSTCSSKLNLLHGLKLLPVSRDKNSSSVQRTEQKPLNLKHHQYNHKGLQDKYPGFWCKLCPFTTISFANFQIHFTYHETRFSKKCSRCNYSCNNIGSLKRHQALHGRKSSSPLKALSPEMSQLNRPDNKQLVHNGSTGSLNNATPTQSHILNLTRNFNESDHKTSTTEVLKMTKLNLSERSMEPVRYSDQSGNQSDTSYDFNLMAIKQEPVDLANEYVTSTPGKHYWQVKCEYCNFNSKLGCTRRDFDEHMRRHSVRARYTCHTCSYSSDILQGVNAHIQFMHPRDIAGPTKKSTYCPDCPFYTDRYSRMETHKIHHSEKFRYQCPHCTYSSDQLGLCNRHIAIHRESTDSMISINPTSTNARFDKPSNSTLGRQYSGDFSDTCKVCSFSSSDRDVLLLHMKEVHGFKYTSSGRLVIKANKGEDFDSDLESLDDVSGGQNCIPLSQDCILVPEDESSGQFDTSLSIVDQQTSIVQKSALFERRTAINCVRGYTPKQYKKKQCPHCPFATMNNSKLVEHDKHHAPDCQLPYKCPYCTFRSAAKRAIGKHLTVHPEHTTHKDPTVKKKASSNVLRVPKVALKFKMSKLKPNTGFVGVKSLKCTKCPYRASKMWNLKQHIKNHQIKKEHGCPYCDFSTGNKASLACHIALHTREVHPENTLSDSGQYQKITPAHQFTSHDRRPVQVFLKSPCQKVPSRQCPHCPFKAYGDGELARHVLSHQSKGKLKCHFCSFRTNHHPALGVHMSCVHKVVSARSAARQRQQIRANLACTNQPTNPDMPLDLSSPKKTPPVAMEMNQPVFPMPEVHANYGSYSPSRAKMTPKKSPKIKRAQCPYCPYRAESNVKVRTHTVHHKQAHKLRYTCLSCNYTTNSKRVLANHSRVHSRAMFEEYNQEGKDIDVTSVEEGSDMTGSDITGSDTIDSFDYMHSGIPRRQQGVYKCSECSYTTSKKNRLRTHLEQHRRRGTFQCPSCSYSCDFKSGIQHHIRYIHEKNVDNTADVSQDYQPPVRPPKAVKKNGKLENVSDVSGQKLLPDVFPNVRMDREAFHEAWQSFKDNFAVSPCCPHCPFSISAKNKGRMFRHLQHHYMKGTHQCIHCSYSTLGNGALGKHKRLHYKDSNVAATEIVSLRCTYCPFSTHKQASLDSHKRYHTEKSLITCHLCNYSCEEQHELSRHLHLHYTAQKYGVQHMDQVHEYEKMKNNRSKSPPNWLECSICPYRTLLDTELQEHRDCHDLKFKHICLFCTFGSDDPNQIEDHLPVHMEWDEHVRASGTYPELWFEGSIDDFNVIVEKPQTQSAQEVESKIGESDDKLAETSTSRLDGGTEVNESDVACDGKDEDVDICPYCDIQVKKTVYNYHIQRHLMGNNMFY